MQEIKVKTHLIITDIQDEYHMNWCGKFFNINPVLNENGLPKFIIVGSNSRMEVFSVDMAYIEKLCKKITSPKGRSAITKDFVRVYIQEINGNEVLMGVFTHQKKKTFAPMYDAVGYR